MELNRVLAFTMAGIFLAGCSGDGGGGGASAGASRVPKLSMVTEIPTVTPDNTPGFVFYSTTDGDITYDGSCYSPVSWADEGENTITFTAMLSGTYADCTITVTDHEGRESRPLLVPTFTIGPVEQILIEYPLEGGLVSESTTTDFEIAFASITENTSSLKIYLNGTEVTELFSPASGAASRSASVYPLSGLLVDGADNCLTATMAYSFDAEVCFTVDTSPELAVGSLTGVSPYTQEGRVVQSALASVSLTDYLSNVIAASLPASQMFSVGFTSMADPAVAGASVTTLAHSTLVATDADGDVDTARFIVPRSRLKTGMAIQVNQAAFDEVEGWLATAVQSQLDALFSGFVAQPNPHASTADLTVSGYDVDALPEKMGWNDGPAACTWINAASNTDYSQCRLYIASLSASGVLVNDVTLKDSGSDSDDIIRLEMSLALPQLHITLDTTAFVADVYQGAMVTAITFYNAALQINLAVSKTTGNIVSVALSDTNAFTMDLGVSDPLIASNHCNVCNMALNPVDAAAAVSVLENSLVQGLEDAVPEINSELAKLAIADQEFYTLIGLDQDDNPGTDVIPVSALKATLSGSEITEAKSGEATAGVFVGLGSRVYADDTGFGAENNDIAALGSYFDPLEAAFSASKLISVEHDVAIALSENMLNQWLLSYFQSRAMSMEKIVFPVAELGEDADHDGVGDLGELMIDGFSTVPQLSIDANDLVSIEMTMKAIPEVELVPGADGVMVLHLNGVQVRVTLYRSCYGDIISTCNTLITSDFTLDMKTYLALDLVNGLPVATLTDHRISFAGQIENNLVADAGSSVLEAMVLDSINQSVKRETWFTVVHEFSQNFIRQNLFQVNNTLVMSLDGSTYNLAGESLWVVPQTLWVDAEGEFIVLGIDIEAVAPMPPTQALFRLHFTE